MSRVGNKLIPFKENLSVEVKEGNVVTVKGPKGELTEKFAHQMTIEVNENHIKITRPNDSIEMRSLHGTTRALLHNMIVGVTEGFTKGLVIEGVGYKLIPDAKNVVVYAGYSHTVPLAIPEGITVKAVTPTEIVLSGIDKQLVGQFAADIRAVRGPEPYHGKGVHYKGEIVRRKEPKKSK